MSRFDRSYLRVDVAGQRFGRLLAISDAGGGRKSNSRPWKCHCDCGREIIIALASLRSGNARSCGCVRRERFTGHTRYIIDLTQETDDEILVEEIRVALEDEFGEMRWPEPRFPLFQQSLSSDFELGRGHHCRRGDEL